MKRFNCSRYIPASLKLKVSDYEINRLIKTHYGKYVDLMYNFTIKHKFFAKNPYRIYVNLFTDRPGLIIGQYGKDIKKFEDDLNKLIPNSVVRVYECGKVLSKAR